MHTHPAMLWRLPPIRLCVIVGTTKKPPSQPVNINTATAEELQHVPGIGPATPVKILQMRESYGAFKSVDDLLAIRGIGKITAPKAAPSAANPTTPPQKPPEKIAHQTVREILTARRSVRNDEVQRTHQITW